jgi:serine beta-lactamase-like protein LACTB, mitochondrial
MRAHRLCLGVLVAFVGGCAPPPAETSLDATGPLPASQLAAAMAESLREVANLPGLSVAVGSGGTILFAEAYGYADLETQRRATPRTRFRAASVSKMITVTALAKLVESGRLDLDASIGGYLPSLPEHLHPITPRQLSGHLAGIPHYSQQDRLERRFYGSTGDALGVFSHIALRGAPGDAYHYSTHGYTLLSAAMEGAAGRPFLELMREELLLPLEMLTTGPDLRASPGSDGAALYVLEEGAPRRVERPEDPSYKWAGGGMMSTPVDLVRLAEAYVVGFLQPSMVATMFTSQRLPSGEETGVGIGWRRSRDMDGRRVLEHAGGMEGARSVVALFPEEGVAVAAMTNTSWSSSIEETAHLLALPFLSPPSPAPQPRGETVVRVTLSSGDQAPITLPGRLRLSEGGGSLSYSPDGSNEQSFPLIYLQRGDRYALVRPDGLFHFTLRAAADGAVRGRAVRYWSQLAESPAGTPPFLTIEGSLPSGN